MERGILLALAAGVVWGIGPLLIKRGMAQSDVSVATLVQQFSAVGFLTLVAGFRGELAGAGLSPGAFWAFVAAGSVGASFGKIFFYKGIDTVGASKSISIKNSSPILTTFLGVVLLGEKVTLPIALGVCLIVAGIYVLTRVGDRGPAATERLGLLIYPFLAAFCFGINPILKKMGVTAANVPTLGALITHATALLIILTAGRLLRIKPKWERVPIQSAVLFALAGLTEALASLLTFHALVYAPAVLVSPIWRISPLVTYLLAHFTLKGIEVVTLRDGLAASFIVGGILVLGRG